MIGDFVASLIRTYVPLLVGMLVAWGVLPADSSEPAIVTLTGLASGAYYLGARLLERRWPIFGWLLGLPKAPTYTST